MRIKEECKEQLTDTRIKCEEYKRKIIFINSSRMIVNKIRVDGCQIIDGIKCDFLVTYDRTENFIELKGENIKHALDQIIRTISILGNNNCYNRNSYIISSRSPLSAADIQNHRLQFKRKYKSSLIVKNSNLEVRI